MSLFDITMLRLKWRGAPGQCGQIIKVSCERGSPLGEHTHEYPEIFWIEEGPCWHLINGTRELLERGDLVFIRAHDCHQFITMGRRRFTMTNLECHPKTILDLQKRHPIPFGKWFDRSLAMPLKLKVQQDELYPLIRLALDSAIQKLDALHTEAFLLDIVRILEPPTSLLPGFSNCPDWLRNALLQAQEKAVFTQGVSGLVQLSGRSPEHVTRQCRRYLNMTPSQVLELHRMEYAERRLRLTTDSVTEIALDCGYSTTSQFYRAFRRCFVQTPLAYRKWLQGINVNNI